MTLDNQTVTADGAAGLVKLQPKTPLVVTVEAENQGGDAVSIERLRLEGRILGLDFFEYDVPLHLLVEPGSVVTTASVAVNLTNLAGQTDGRVPVRVSLLGPDDEVVGTHTFTADVDGSTWSVFGILALTVLALTLLCAVALAFVLLSLRWASDGWPAVLAGGLGLGVGLSIVFVLSMSSVVTPTATVWLLIALPAACIGAGLAYLPRALEARTPV